MLGDPNWRCRWIHNLTMTSSWSAQEQPEKHTTLTIMALTYRAADHSAEEFRTGSV